MLCFFFFQAEDGIRDHCVTGVQTCALPISVDVATVQIAFESGTLAIITASRATEEKIRTLAVTQPDAYVVLDYSEQDIRIHRRAAQEYTLNRESIRYRRDRKSVV